MMKKHKAFFSLLILLGLFIVISLLTHPRMTTPTEHHIFHTDQISLGYFLQESDSDDPRRLLMNELITNWVLNKYISKFGSNSKGLDAEQLLQERQKIEKDLKHLYLITSNFNDKNDDAEIKMMMELVDSFYLSYAKKRRESKWFFKSIP